MQIKNAQMETEISLSCHGKEQWIFAMRKTFCLHRKRKIMTLTTQRNTFMELAKKTNMEVNLTVKTMFRERLSEIVFIMVKVHVIPDDLKILKPKLLLLT